MTWAWLRQVDAAVARAAATRPPRSTGATASFAVAAVAGFNCLKNYLQVRSRPAVACCAVHASRVTCGPRGPPTRAQVAKLEKQELRLQGQAA
jgi:hypothetical protein